METGGSLRLYGAQGRGADRRQLDRAEPAGRTRQAYQASRPGHLVRRYRPAARPRCTWPRDVRSGPAPGTPATGSWWPPPASAPSNPNSCRSTRSNGCRRQWHRVTLTQPLQHYHFGGADPGLPSAANYGAGATTNFGVDERAEVGLISRNISFTARRLGPGVEPRRPEPMHWGGEIRILAGFAETSIQGVELEKFGKARLGSYPIHFHMAGDAGTHVELRRQQQHPPQLQQVRDDAHRPRTSRSTTTSAPA